MSEVSTTLPAPKAASRPKFLETIHKELEIARPGRWDPLGYLFIGPMVLFYIMFQGWPIVRGFFMAFTDYRLNYPKTAWEFNGFNNFTELFADPKIYTYMSISFQAALMNVPVVLLLALILSVLIASVKRWAGLYRWLIYMPAVMPVSVVFLTWNEFFGPKYGFIGAIFRSFGVRKAPAFLMDSSTVLAATVVVENWRVIGFSVIILLVGIYSIDPEIFEAATIDGAGWWKTFRHITLPLLKNQLLVLMISASGALSIMVPQMLLAPNGGPKGAAMTFGYFMYLQGVQGDRRLGYASSGYLLIAIIAAIWTFFWLKTLQEKN
jgi:multiple sugar transport system permease protein